MSIIPGIDTRAPYRTDINKGFSLSPKVDPIMNSTFLMAASTSSFIMATVASWPTSLYLVHTSVVIVKPGGTGTPVKFISARLAPLPPATPKSFLLISLNHLTNSAINDS